jgi:hypothetical protein
MAPKKLAANVEKKLNTIAATVGQSHVDVGFLENARYPNGQSVAEVAFWNEYGHATLFGYAPPRPFFRPMIKREKPTWATKTGKLLKHNNYNSWLTLEVMGEDIDGALQESIGKSPVLPLSATTLILRERFPGARREDIKFEDVLKAVNDANAGEQGATGTLAKPLVWSGDMLRATGFKVQRGLS